VSINYIAVLTTAIGMLLYMVSKDGGVSKCGLAAAFFMFVLGIFIYLYIFVWGRKSGSGHWEESEEIIKRESVMKVEEVRFIHPFAGEYHDLCQSSSL